MSASKLIHSFASNPATCWFKASSPPDNVTLNAAYGQPDQSDFLTGIGVAVYAILDMEQLIFHTRTAPVYTIASLQGSDREVIPVSEVFELLPKIHYILDNAIPEWVSNMAHILAYLFHCFQSVLLSPFLHNYKNTVPAQRLACMVALTGLWLRLNNNVHLACPGLPR